MGNFSFIHTADVHLDSPLLGLSAYEGAPLDLLRNAPREAFSQLIDEAIRERVDFMVIAGDLYDGGWKDFNTGLYFSTEMGRLKRENIPVFIVYGNHDAESELTKQLFLPDNVSVFSARKSATFLLDDIKVALHGQSFREAKTENNLAINYPSSVPEYFNIGVLHTALEGHALHAPYAPCSLSDLTDKGYDYWALGHVHDFQILCKAPMVVFSGNIQGRHIRETGPRGAVLVTVENHKPTVERLFVDTLRWVKIEIDVRLATSIGDFVRLAKNNLETLLQEKSCGRPLAVRIVFSGKTSAHGEVFGLEHQLRQEVLSVANGLSVDNLWIEKIVLNTMATFDSVNIEARSDAIADLRKILTKIGEDQNFQQNLITDLMEMINKAPLALIDQVPALVEIKAGDINAQLESVSAALIAQLSSNGESD